MEQTIKRIINIDRDAENYKKDMDNLLSDKKKELENLLEQLKSDYEKDISKEKKMLIEKRIDEAKKYAIVLIEEREAQVQKLKSNYSACREEIIDTCFTEIISHKEV